jgi:omega-amidase
MEEFLRVTLLQTDLFWEDTTANLAMLEEKIFALTEETDVIILPEMFNSGFSTNVAQTAEPMNFTTHRWMKQLAAQTRAVITGSLAIKIEGKVVNRLLWVEPNGTTSFYDKRHLFRMGFENEEYTAGQKQVVFEWKDWKICPIICYDLRFPVWSRNQHLRYDVLLNVASWPASRSNVWQTLLSARAIENLAYTIGVNRVGTDGNNVHHKGLSAVYDFKGLPINIPSEKEEICTLTLSRTELIRFRTNFPAYLDADDFYF